MTLGTKVQPNLVPDWRKIYRYDKSVDAIVTNVGNGCADTVVNIPSPVVGDVYTISFDAWGSTEDNKVTTHCIPLRQKDIIACATGGSKLSDNGHVEWYNLSEKRKRYFTTYKMEEGAAKYIIIRARTGGTTYIRNIKLEKSPYPTDYEE